jgi:hypothetical protein
MVGKGVFDVFSVLRVRRLSAPADEPQQFRRKRGVARNERFSRGRK